MKKERGDSKSRAAPNTQIAKVPTDVETALSTTPLLSAESNLELAFASPPSKLLCTFEDCPSKASGFFSAAEDWIQHLKSHKSFIPTLVSLYKTPEPFG